MVFDLKSYLIGKHGGAYTPSADLPSYLMGKKKSASIKTITGVPPLTFVSDGSSLVDWSISGAAGGVGDRTKNLVQVPAAALRNHGVTFTPFRETGEIVPIRTGEQTEEAAVSYTMILPAGSYIFTCNADSTFSTYDSYIRDATSTIARDNPNLSPGNGFTLSSETEVRIHHRIRLGTDITNLVFRPMIRLADTASDFEPYGYKIPISCGGVTTNIFTQSQLMDGDVLTLADTGIDIPTVKGENTLSVDTTVQPENVTIVYKGG